MGTATGVRSADTHRTSQPSRPSAISSHEKAITEILATAGITVNGAQPWDMQVHHPRLFRRILAGGSLAIGESYMDGWWDAERLDELLTRVHRHELYNRVSTLRFFWLALRSRIFNRQQPSCADTVARRHYDLGNDLYEGMLDRNMQYTCAYWTGAETLDQAQEQKLELICRKLQISPGMRILELGCGFGGLAYHLARHHGCSVTAYNISTEQIRFARARCAGLPVRFQEKDYREAIQEPEQFDRVVSVGLCEHVGHRNYRKFMELAHRSLRDEGLFFLHTIGGNRSYTATDPWIDKYIFPNGLIPSITQLGSAMEGLWVMEDWHNFGPDYDKTLLAWWRNFESAWPGLQAKYGDRFYRMWKYYIMGCAGGFRSRKLQLWQIVLSKGDLAAYASVR